MTELLEVALGVGMGSVQFGMSRARVVSKLGRPNDVEEIEIIVDHQTVGLHWDLGVSCWFDADDDFRLGCIQLRSMDSVLAGEKLMGLSRQFVVQSLVPMLGAPEETKVSSEDQPEEWVVRYDLHGLDLWFTQNRMRAIYWSYLFEPEHKTIIWPSP